MGNGFGKRERALKRRAKDAEAGQRSALAQAREATKTVTEIGRVLGIRGVVEPQHVVDVATDMVRALRMQAGGPDVVVTRDAEQKTIERDAEWARATAREGWRALEREVDAIYSGELWSEALKAQIRAYVESRLEDLRQHGFILRAGGEFEVLWKANDRSISVVPRDPVLAETGETIDARVRSLEANVNGHERQLSETVRLCAQLAELNGEAPTAAALRRIFSGDDFDDVIDEEIVNGTEIRPGTIVLDGSLLTDLGYVLDGVRARFGDETVAKAAEERIRRELQRGGFIT